MKKAKSSVILRATTWCRESGGLFDYECNIVTKKNLKASTNTKIVRVKNDIHLVNESSDEKMLSDNAKTLAHLRFDEDSYTVIRSTRDIDYSDYSGSSLPWLVVRSVRERRSPEGFRLTKNDIMKLGKFKLRVREAVSTTIQDKMSKKGKSIDCGKLDNETVNFMRVLEKPNEDLKDVTCRICLSNDTSEENPFISPCACSGSVKYLHLGCFRKWMMSLVTIKNYGMCITYYWKKLECELCKAPFPEAIIIDNNNIIELLEYSKPPESSYIVLETIAKEKRSKTFFVILTTDNYIIRMGRGNDCDARLNDLSVSRCHSLIKYSAGEFYLNDNGSKFGTLVLIKGDYKLRYDYDAEIQFGRTVISFSCLSLNPISTSLEKKEVEGDIEDPVIGHFDLLLKRGTASEANLIESEKEMKSSESYSPRIETRENEREPIKKMYSLTFDKDKTDYTHLKEIIDKNMKIYGTTNPKYIEDKGREKKNILDEMEHLNIRESDEESDDHHLSRDYRAEN